MSEKQKIAFIALTVVLAVGIIFCGVGWRLVQQDLDSAMTELSEARAALESDDEESEIATGSDEVENYADNKTEENRNKVERSGPLLKKGPLDILA